MSATDVKLVLRSTRVVTPEGTRPATVAVADGKIDAVVAYDAEVPEGARLEDFGDDVLLPGLVDTHVHVNDPGRTEWEGFYTATRAAAAAWDHHPARHAAQLPPADHHRRAPARQAAGGRTQGAHRHRLLGRCDPVQREGPAPAVRGRGLRLQVLPVALRRRGVPRAGPGAAGPLDGGDRRIRRAPDRARRGPAPPGGGAAARRPRLRGLPGLPAARRREHRDRGADRPRQAAERPRPRTAPVLQRRAAADRRGQARGGAGHGRVLPALPHPHRGGSPGRRHRVQVLPAHPRGGQPGRAVGGARGRHHRLHRLRPLALHHRPQDAGLRLRVGWDLLPPARSARHLDRGPQARPLARRRRPLDVGGPRRAGRAARQGCDRGGPGRRLRGPGPRRHLHRRPGRAVPPQPGHRVQPAGPCTVSSGPPGCAAYGSRRTACWTLPRAASSNGTAEHGAERGAPDRRRARGPVRWVPAGARRWLSVFGGYGGDAGAWPGCRTPEQESS